VIHVEEGEVARITIDRPAARNALDLEAIEALSAALGRLDARVVVLTGAGDRVFCAGADLAALAGQPQALRAAARRYGELLAQLRASARPVVARVNGACLAGGVGLMLACDLAVASPRAELFLPEANVGMWPMVVGALLRDVVGRRVALDLAMTGRRLDPPECVRLGIYNRLGDDVDVALAPLVAALLRASPSALRLGRRAWREAADLPLPQALEQLADRLGDLMETEDAAEGIVAFLSKRPPEWKDR
jgi:enoyl-CoA hydratase/carnithine racemase